MKPVVLCFIYLLIPDVVYSSIKCRENIYDLKNICTVDAYTSQSGTVTEFALNPIYRKDVVTDLRFIKSNVAQIPNEIFTNLENLRILNLTDCQIVKMSQTTFTFSNNLRELILPHNRITELIDSIFDLAYNLERIDLSHNQIQSIDVNVFNSLEKLRVIDLSYNFLKIESSCIFPAFLSQLNLNFNQIRNFSIIDSNVIQNITINNNNLIVLKLNSYVKSLHADFNYLESQNIHFNNSNLISLSLRNNSIDNFNIIGSMSNLTFLDLSFNPKNNKLIEFTKPINLKTLILKSTNLKQSDIKSFSVLRNLEKLDLSSNNLTYIDFNSISHLENIKYLNLSTNNLNSLTFNKFDYLFPNLSAIDVSENNWICMDLIAILTKLKRLKINVEVTNSAKINTNIRGIRCTTSTKQIMLKEADETNTSNSNAELIQILNDFQNDNVRLKRMATEMLDKLNVIETNDDVDKLNVIVNKLVSEVSAANINDKLNKNKLDNLEKVIINKMESSFVELYDVKVYLIAVVPLVALLFMAGLVFVIYKKCCGQNKGFNRYYHSTDCSISKDEQQKVLYA